MHFHECPTEWEYGDHPNHHLLPTRCTGLLIQLRTAQLCTEAISRDSRPAHATLFENMTPPACPYFAGNYRGSNFRCLKYVEVGVAADPRVGVKPDNVATALDNLSETLRTGFGALDAARNIPNARLPVEDKIYYVVTFASRVFVEFLRIHPYVNGNGHIARFLIWAVLGKYGYWPKKWPLNARPPDPPYSEYIKQYRDGNPQLLETFVLKCLLGEI